ncbi:MAG: hypothetical protein Q8R79_03885 [Legionellaceae bacterium]|nr:hypothetical protein [Legionellaceae bacterium]
MPKKKEDPQDEPVLTKGEHRRRALLYSASAIGLCLLLFVVLPFFGVSMGFIAAIAGIITCVGAALVSKDNPTRAAYGALALGLTLGVIFFPHAFLVMGIIGSLLAVAYCAVKAIEHGKRGYTSTPTKSVTPEHPHSDEKNPYMSPSMSAQLHSSTTCKEAPSTKSLYQRAPKKRAQDFKKTTQPGVFKI